MRTLVIFVLGLLPCLAHPQFSNDSLHYWSGEPEDFIYNENSQIQLQVAEAGTSAIWRKTAIPDSARWEICFLLDFPPSSANSVEIFLFADSAKADADNALFMKLGESGSDDRLRFFLRENGNDLPLATSGSSFGDKPAAACILVDWSRQRSLMQLDTDRDGRYDEAMGFPLQLSLPDSAFFGLKCRYTSTRVSHFYFENISLQPKSRDATAPALTAFTVRDSSSLSIEFDEPLDSAAANRHSNYSIQPSLPLGIIKWNALQAHSIELQYAGSFVPGQEYLIEIEGVEDLNGNSRLFSHTFSYEPAFPPEQGELIINELHPIPSALTELPEVEFVEILNKGARKLDLGGLILEDASGQGTVGSAALRPGEYALLCSASDSNLLGGYGKVVAVSGFPALNNGGDELRLISGSGLVLDELTYDRDFYQSESKWEGGWSLERIDPDRNCPGASNWRESTDPSGGSPGRRNSVFDSLYEGNFRLIDLQVLDKYSLQLCFDQPMDAASLLDLQNYQLSPQMSIEQVIPSGLNFDCCEIVCSDSLDGSLLYSIELGEGLRSCMGGKEVKSGEYIFGLPDQPREGDLKLSEIMYDPAANGGEYIELYNASGRVLDSRHLMLAVENGSGNLKWFQTESGGFILPGSYPVICDQRSAVLETFPEADSSKLIAEGLPNLVNGGASIRLHRTSDSLLLEQCTYGDEMHDPLLNNTGGVSLERVSYAFPAEDAASWYSAATLEWSGSPTSKNTQAAASAPDTTDNNFSLLSPTFSPDGDGHEDQLLIAYRFDQAGYIATVKIFDLSGNLVYLMLDNQSLGSEGLLHWNGFAADNLLQPIGMYIVDIAVVLSSGKSKREKLKAVLARHLD